MSWLWILAGVLGLVVVVVAWGAMLPRAHTCTVAREHPASAETLWALLTDVERFPTWRPDVKSVDVRERSDDGTPTAWTEHTRFSPMPMRIVERERPHRLVGKIDTDELPFEGTWTYVLEEAGPGRSRLTLTEDGVVKNPVFRFLSRFVFGHDRTMNTYQDAVAAAAVRHRTA